MTQISPQQVTDRIDDWISRLNGLYDTLDDWMASIPHDRVERGTLRQTIEPYMRQFDVPPRELPTYTIFQGQKRIEFAPSVLLSSDVSSTILFDSVLVIVYCTVAAFVLLFSSIPKL